MKIGDRVSKISGYGFIGTIVSVFRTLEGETRIVAQMDTGDNGGGLLHIFSEANLQVLDAIQ